MTRLRLVKDDPSTEEIHTDAAKYQSSDQYPSSLEHLMGILRMHNGKVKYEEVKRKSINDRVKRNNYRASELEKK